MQSVRSRPPELRGCDAQPSLLTDFLPLFSFDRGEPSPLLPSPSRRSNARSPCAARVLSRSRRSARLVQYGRVDRCGSGDAEVLDRTENSAAILEVPTIWNDQRFHCHPALRRELCPSNLPQKQL